MNPETCLIAGVLVLFATIALNRFLGERNYATLSPEDRMKLTDAFSTHRSLATYLPIGIMLVVIAVGYGNPRVLPVAFPAGVVLVLVVSLALQLAILRRLKQLALPENYVANFRVQAMLVQTGNIAALSLFAYGVIAGIN